MRVLVAVETISSTTSDDDPPAQLADLNAKRDGDHEMPFTLRQVSDSRHQAAFTPPRNFSSPAGKELSDDAVGVDVVAEALSRRRGGAGQYRLVLLLPCIN